MFRITFSIQNMPAFELAMAGLVKNMSDITPIAPEIVEKGIRPILTMQFGTEGGSGASGPWSPLEQAYAAAKLKRWGAKPILVASGRLRDHDGGDAALGLGDVGGVGQRAVGDRAADEVAS